MPSPDGAVGGWVRERATRLRFPVLFALTAALFVLDLLVPDLIPFVDEILLGLATVLLGSLRTSRRRSPPDREGTTTIDVESAGDGSISPPGPRGPDRERGGGPAR